MILKNTTKSRWEMDDIKINPFKHDCFLGYISQVLPQFVKVHFPSSVLLNGFTHYGKEFNGGLVGSFVVIEGERFGFLGRIIELTLAESERLALNERAFQASDFHPTGKIEILLSFDLFEPLSLKNGMTSFPNIGAKVFVSSDELVQEYMSRFGIKDQQNVGTTQLGKLVSSTTEVKVNLQSIFSRHCAVVGTTGGGKSFTVSKLIQSLIEKQNKAILIDPTGEYSNFNKLSNCKYCDLGTGFIFHYSNLSITDLFLMFRPAGQVQQPLLLEAINSLKLASILQRDKTKFKYSKNEELETFSFEGKNSKVYTIDLVSGCIIKRGKETSPFNRLCAMYSKELNDFNTVNFDILKLTTQINNECFQISGNAWSSQVDNRTLGNASSLILRIHQTISDPEFKKIFGFQDTNSIDVITELKNFIAANSSDMLLKIGFDNVPFSYQIREIVANAIGYYLLQAARTGKFDSKKSADNKPLVLFIDEAHQFTNKSVKDEFFENVKLDSFDLIAKECRKHGLFLCIATQMPRDIPQGTLSQMGTFIVHRLINHNDKEAINNACSSANKNTLDFLPILGEGEAILTGVDFPMPIILKIDLPTILPNSKTPKLTN